MWRVTIIINCLILFLFWVAGFVATAPAFNHFVQYTEVFGKLPLPILTDAVFTVRMSSLIVPGCWLLGSFGYLFWIRQMDEERRRDQVSLHTSLTILVGLLFFVIFLTAGVLPYLKIGALLD